MKTDSDKKCTQLLFLCLLNHDINVLSSCYSPDTAHGLQTGFSSGAACAHAVLLVDSTPVITLEETLVNDLFR